MTHRPLALLLLAVVLLLAGCRGSGSHKPAPGHPTPPPAAGVTFLTYRGAVTTRPLISVKSAKAAASPAVGEALSTTDGTWTGTTPITYTYQWVHCDSAGASCGNIGGATASSYTIVAGDVGHTIRARVTAANSAGSALQDSAQTGAVTSGGGGGAFVSGVCSPSPCTQSGATSYSISTTDSSGAPYGNSSSPKTVNISFLISRPGNLSTASQAPAVIVSCDTSGSNAPWYPAAAADKFVLIIMSSAIPGGPGQCNFQPPVVKWKNNLAYTCGTSGTQECDNIPGLVSILNAVECSGSPPCQNVNSHEVFYSGDSEAGQFGEGAVCDTRTSSRIAGIQVVSNTLVSPGQITPSSVYTQANAKPPNCPALLGVGSLCHADCVSVAPNTDVNIQYLWGTTDSIFGGPSTSCSISDAHNCLGNGFYFTSEPDMWRFGDIPLATTILGPVLGCPSTPAATTYNINGTGSGGTPNAMGVLTSTFTPCTNSASPSQTAIQTVQIRNGTHIPDTWPAGTSLGGSDGMATPATAWSFWTRYFK
jgi:hypothetical protein